MKEYTLEKAVSLPHLSLFDRTTVITELGLYEDVVIDTYDLRYFSSQIDEKYIAETYISGKDANVLFAIRANNEPFMLPCIECEHKQPFKDVVKRMDARRYTMQYGDEKYLSTIISDESSPASIFTQNPDYLKEEESKEKCMEDVLSEPFIHREYACVLNPNHKVSVSFVVEKLIIKDDVPAAVAEYREKMAQWDIFTEEEPVMSPEVQKYYDDRKKVEGYVIIKKIGQYPSMADMQYYEGAKYRRVLKKHYRDYSLALGLMASGVGCGSFIYLRRVFEYLVERLHLECKEMANWTEEEYKKSDFNNKIRIIEQFGKIIIPNELAQVRNKIYGVLSKGVHQSSDQECLEIFSYVKYALELIMDEQIMQLDRKEQLKELQRKLGSF